MPISFYGQIYLAITDFHFYPRIFHQPIRRTLVFLLLLSAHVALILTCFFAWRLFPILDQFTDWARFHLPSFKVERGVLEVDAEQPVVLHYDANQQIVTFVFDTTGTYTETEGLREPVFLLTREELQLRVEGQSQTYSWLDFGTFSIEAQEWSDLNQILKWVYFPFGYAFFLLWGGSGKVLAGALLSLLSYSTASRYGVRPSFSSVFAVAVYSLVPAIVIDLGVQFTGLNIFYRDFIYLATAAVYTYLATQKCVVPK